MSPLERIGDVPQPCTHREHAPPSHMVFKPGVYRWTCPGCGHAMIFTVRGITHRTWTGGRPLDVRWRP